MTNPIDNQILHAVFCMSRNTMSIDAGSLGRVVGATASDAAASLVRLERAGLIDASRARLTMLGLARAAAAGSDLGGAGIDLSAAKATVRASVPPPLAAAPAASATASAHCGGVVALADAGAGAAAGAGDHYDGSVAARAGLDDRASHDRPETLEPANPATLPC